jgi:hypothetical protein
VGTILQPFPGADVSRCHLRTERRVAAWHVLFVQPVELIAVMFVLLLLALATLPMWPYSTKWTYYPAGGCGLLVTVIVLLALGGRL